MPERPPAPAPAWPADSTEDRALREAILQTVVYADLFDYPLTVDELTHYLIGVESNPELVATLLKNDPVLVASVEQKDNWCFLRGRGHILGLRQDRASSAGPLWRQAEGAVRVLRRFPFVRMIAVTGALAMDNVEANADIDLLVVTVPGRVWICRRLLILAVHAFRLRGVELCPNFILAAGNLPLNGGDLFTAHELAQMRPLFGYDLYCRMLAANAWMHEFLPNADPWPPPRESSHAGLLTVLQAAAEKALACRGFQRWENWELGRLQRKIGVPDAEDEEICFTPAQCKGHTGHYRRQVGNRFAQRIATMTEALSQEGIIERDWAAETQPRAPRPDRRTA